MSNDLPDLVGHRTVTADAVATFGALTGDYSRIHFDHALGASTPWGKGFAHGLLGASWALGMLFQHHPDRLAGPRGNELATAFSVRFRSVVPFGETVGLRCGDATGSSESDAGTVTAFDLVGAAGEVATSGTVTRRSGFSPCAVDPWPRDESPVMPGAPLMAQDLMACARGAVPIRTVTEADVVGFAGFTGDLGRLHMDREFAARGPFGASVVPPMLCFCLAFAAWLREFLRLPLPGDEASAGHLGDRWELLAPVFPGDTLEVRHRALALRRTRSRPDEGVLTFGLQVLNQRERPVLHGEVDMMLQMAPSAYD